MIRVLIIAAYASVRAGLHMLLADATDCEVVGEVSGSAELETALSETRPDVAILDYNEGDGTNAIEIVARTEAGLVVLGDDRSGYRRMAEYPLRGWAYLLKEAEGPEIAGAVRGVVAGLVVLDRSLTPLLIAAPPGSVEDESRTTWPGIVSGDPLVTEPLTGREREVLQWMAQGLSNKLIAARLSISLHTVKFHVASILAKLGASSRTEAVTIGARRGYVAL